MNIKASTAPSREMRSKYRSIINEVVRYFKENPKINIAKITCLTGSDADRLARKVKEWILPEEKFFNITRKANEVYFVRIEDGEET